MRAERSAERLRVVGLWRGRLPRGCELCMRGLKVVVFVTGFCEANCYYCPVGIGRRDPDALYVDEERVDSLDRVLEEIEVVGARGISITGGEPLSAIERVEKILRLVKDVYGQGFHVHLYTHGGYATREVLRRLDRLGLDEIRFHPRYPQSFRSLEYAARETSMDVGVEVPAIPGAAEGLCKVAAYAERLGARFININELEYSESNLPRILLRGLRPVEGKPYVRGSLETALEVMRCAEERGLAITVHFCPALYKDLVQTRLRLLRKALSLAGPHEEVTDSGTLRTLEIPRGVYEELIDALKRLGGIVLVGDGVAYLNPVMLRSLPREVVEVLERYGSYEEYYPSLTREAQLVTEEGQ